MPEMKVFYYGLNVSVYVFIKLTYTNNIQAKIIETVLYYYRVNNGFIFAYLVKNNKFIFHLLLYFNYYHSNT